MIKRQKITGNIEVGYAYRKIVMITILDEFFVRAGNIGEFEKKNCNKTLINTTKSDEINLA